jgi:hypothetical protein
MRKFWQKNNEPPSPDTAAVTWEEGAKQSIEQAVVQAPVPAVLKGRIKQELMKAAEVAAQKAGRTKVTPEDVMAGLLAKMPAAMRNKVEQAIQEGPEGLKNLERDLRNQK